jgi:hypothetical protein
MRVAVGPRAYRRAIPGNRIGMRLQQNGGAWGHCHEGRAVNAWVAILWLAACAAFASLLTYAVAISAQSRLAFLPVGVRYRQSDDPEIQRRDLEELRRLRFNVVELVQADDREAPPLLFIDRLLAGAPDPRVLLPLDTPPATIRIGPETLAGEVSVEAWSAIARAKSGVIFLDWTTLLANPDALAAASQFAEAVARNMALYAPLRPAGTAAGERRVRVTGGAESVDATLLESAEALVFIALNRSAREQRVTMTFSPDVPEAIWQNMLAGGAVSFVAGAEGPFYERAFPPRDVLVLAIKKGRR